jgi:type IV secretion system protein VirD4
VELRPLAGSGALLGGLLGLLWNVALLQPPDLHHGVVGLLLGGLAGSCWRWSTW